MAEIHGIHEIHEVTETADLIASAITPLLKAENLDLEALEITPMGKRRVIRILIDSDGGISLDQVAKVSKAVSAELDRLDESGSLGQTPYVLEVSSPGVDRPLTLARHWRRNISRLVSCSMVDGSKVLGRIISTGEDVAQLQVEDVEQSIRYEDVKKAHIEIEFNRTGEK